MTAETIHTCSYECERPECIRAQRDELAARLTAAMSQPEASAPVGVEASYHPCTSVLIEGLKRLEGGSDVLAEWDRARAKADTALAQQPAAVDEAAAIRAFEEHFEASSDDPYFEGELELWLTAWRKALSAQHQEPKP